MVYYFTRYFERILLKRPEVRREWCIFVLEHPIRAEKQPNGRVRYWGQPPGQSRFLRVVTLEDQVTILNAFFDRRFRP